MFVIYEILKHTFQFELNNLKFIKKCESLEESKSPTYYINKYKLISDGWCFIMVQKHGESFGEFLLIDIESDRITRSDILPIIRDLKISEILD